MAFKIHNCSRQCDSFKTRTIAAVLVERSIANKSPQLVLSQAELGCVNNREISCLGPSDGLQAGQFGDEIVAR